MMCNGFTHELLSFLGDIENTPRKQEHSEACTSRLPKADPYIGWYLQWHMMGCFINLKVSKMAIDFKGTV